MAREQKPIPLNAEQLDLVHKILRKLNVDPEAPLTPAVQSKLERFVSGYMRRVEQAREHARPKGDSLDLVSSRHREAARRWLGDGRRCPARGPSTPVLPGVQKLSDMEVEPLVEVTGIKWVVESD